MPPAPGQVLLHYRLAELIGEGGMGQVWRATDTTLNRDVAIKILPEDVSGDPERIGRFQREAHVLAALNHPGIAAIHGLHEVPRTDRAAQPVRFLVMELVPGEDLAAKLAAGPIPVPDALLIAKQMAEALEAAHEQGIIHRDLKPANVKLTPDGKVKLLDFGLAKALDPTASASGSASKVAKSPTLTLGATVHGVILGTAAYMAPEQAAGAAVDRRADVWAFGVVLYEILAGRRLFVGETTSHVLASVLKDAPDFGAIPKDTPAPIVRLLRRCLRKKARERLQAIGDARVVIDEVLSGVYDEAGPATAAPAPVRASAIGRMLAVAAAALAIGGIGATWWLGRGAAPAAAPHTVSELVLPNGMFARGMALSPDGKRLVFMGRAAAESKWALWIRNIGSRDVRMIPGTAGAQAPFWSPDGRSLGFVADRQLKRVDVEGGDPIRLATVEAVCGATWGRDAIVYCSGWNHRGLMRIAPTGGEPTAITKPGDQDFHFAPSFLEHGPTLVYNTVKPADPAGTARRRFLRLDGKVDREIMTVSSKTEYTGGRLFFLRGTTLLAKPFDPSTGELGGGDAEIVAEGVDDFRGGVFTVAPGLLVYAVKDRNEGSRITWYGRDGKVRDSIDADASLDDLTVSRDGRRVAVMKAGTSSKSDAETSDVWTLELDRKIFSRATFGEEDDDPVFSPDGTRIAFAHNGSLYVRATNGAGEPKLVQESTNDIVSSDWTPDGWILYTDIKAGNNDMFAVRESGGEPRPLGATPFDELTPQVSPDGRWLAYSSDEGGDRQVYLTRWPSLDGKWRVSKDRAAMPRWSGDGRTLYFLTGDRRIFRASVGAGAAEPSLGLPEECIRTNSEGTLAARASRWAVLPDGSGFLVLEALPGQGNPGTSVVLVTQPLSPTR